MPRKSESEEHPMNEIVKVKLSEIDPESTVNVRRDEKNIKESIERVKSSIEEKGYWPEFPIVLRPHPDLQSKFAYENVSGQCRMKASLDCGLKEIPAFVVDLSDDEALQRSLGEGDKRTPLLFSDYTYWVEKKYDEFRRQGCNAKEAFEKTATFWNISVDRARKYHSMGNLPASVKKKVDEKILSQKVAKAIADSSRGFFDDDPQEAEKIMEEKAEAYLEQDEDQRKDFEEVMKKSGHKATIEEIEKKVEKQANDAKSGINNVVINNIVLPAKVKTRMMQWGKKRGLHNSSPSDIAGNLIVEALEGKE